MDPRETNAPSPVHGLGVEDKCRTKAEGEMARGDNDEQRETRRRYSSRRRDRSVRRSARHHRGDGPDGGAPSSAVTATKNIRASYQPAYLRSFRSALRRCDSAPDVRRAGTRGSSDPSGPASHHTEPESSNSDACASSSSFSGKVGDEASLPLGGIDTFLPHLDVGDVGSPGDMIRQGFDQDEAARPLQRHDFAFVLRSDGVSWTYAIVAEASESSILFVVDGDGSTKRLSRGRWATRIRLVNAEAAGLRVRHARIAAALAPLSSSSPCLEDLD